MMAFEYGGGSTERLALSLQKFNAARKVEGFKLNYKTGKHFFWKQRFPGRRLVSGELKAAWAKLRQDEREDYCRKVTTVRRGAGIKQLGKRLTVLKWALPL